MSDIPLHPQRALDPHLTYCPRCGGDGTGIVIGRTTVAHVPGKPDQIITCWTYGKGKQVREELERRQIAFDTRDAKENERLPDGDICDSCKKEMNEHLAIVEAGGVYFKCAKCSVTGVIRAEAPLAKHVREAHGIAAPKPCGIQFEDCSQHQVAPETEG